MGAEFNFQQLDALNYNEAIEEGKELISEAKVDYGVKGYTGTWAECKGVKVVSLPTDCTDVVQWLDDNCEKWGPMLIVRFNEHYYAGALCSC